MKVFVVNVFFNEIEQPQVNRVFQLAEDGTQKEIVKEELLFEKSGTVVLACEDEIKIMDTLKQRISDKITSFELVSETDLTPPVEEPATMQVLSEGETLPETEPVGQIIFQMGI